MPLFTSTADYLPQPLYNRDRHAHRQSHFHYDQYQEAYDFYLYPELNDMYIGSQAQDFDDSHVIRPQSNFGAKKASSIQVKARSGNVDTLNRSGFFWSTQKIRIKTGMLNELEDLANILTKDLNDIDSSIARYEGIIGISTTILGIIAGAIQALKLFFNPTTILPSTPTNNTTNAPATSSYSAAYLWIDIVSVLISTVFTQGLVAIATKFKDDALKIRPTILENLNSIEQSIEKAANNLNNTI